MSVPRLSVRQSFAVTLELVPALWDAWFIRTFRSTTHLRLDPVSPDTSWPDDLTPLVIQRIDSIVRICVFWKRKRCFYRSFALARVLRRRGLPVVVNFGYRGLRNESTRRAHCWLTLNGEVVAESDSPKRSYPHRLGGIPGEFEYHLGGDEDLGHA